MRCSLIGAENLIARIDAPIHFQVNGTLSLFVSTPNPPLWNAFIDKVSEGDECKSLMDYIGHKCFYDDLPHKNEYGERLENPMSLSLKMEKLLRICMDQREKHIERLRSSGDTRCSAVRPAQW